MSQGSDSEESVIGLDSAAVWVPLDRESIAVPGLAMVDGRLLADPPDPPDESGRESARRSIEEIKQRISQIESLLSPPKSAP